VCGEGDCNDDDQKCNEYRDGSVACVDERREKEGSVYRSRGHGWRRARGKEKREQAWRPTPFEAEAREAGEGWGSGGGATRGRENGEERGGPGAVEGTVRWPASAPSWQPRAAGLWHDRGGRRGAGDPARARLTDTVGRRQGPVGSAWVREGVRGSEAVVASGC
jgi:hypothetical protein